jgi:hypothetical protein
MTKIKRKITKINDSAADSAVAEDVLVFVNSKGKAPSAPAAVPAAVPAAKGKAKTANVPQSPGSDDSSTPDWAQEVSEY